MTVFTPLEAINRLCDKREIFYDEMVDLMRQVMDGKVSQVQLAAIPVDERIGDIGQRRLRGTPPDVLEILQPVKIPHRTGDHPNAPFAVSKEIVGQARDCAAELLSQEPDALAVRRLASLADLPDQDLLLEWC